MITINKLTDLERFGIFYLTGEADNLGYRALCDVSQRGKDLLREVYGMTADSPHANSETLGEKHVASVMLSYRAWQDIGPVGLLDLTRHPDHYKREPMCHTVFSVKDGTIFGIQGKEVFKQAESAEFSTDNGKTWRSWPTCYGELHHMYSQASEQPHVGSRNIHACSGQVFA